MNDRPTHRSRLEEILRPNGNSATPPAKDATSDEVEGACAAFGYLRGIRDFASAVEFRFQNGNRVWFAYSLLGHWRYNPSEGILLRFSGDLVYVVLIRGSNLDKPLNDGAIDLTAAIQRHRATWVRVMSDAEIRQVGETGPTVDSIELAEFESHAALKEWLGKTAPAFLER